MTGETGGTPKGPERRERDGLIALLDSWMADESGYDEETWPALKRDLDRNRLGYRKIFGGGQDV